jgi:hypothetical protein
MVADEIAISIRTETNELATDFEVGRDRVKTVGRILGPTKVSLAFCAWGSLNSNS